MKVCCVFSLESPHRGDSNDDTQHTIINIKKKITLNNTKYNKVCRYGIILLGTQELVRNSRGKRPISVRTTEVLLYILRRILLWVVPRFVRLYEEKRVDYLPYKWTTRGINISYHPHQCRPCSV